MISQNDCFPQPTNIDIKLWRYMDLSKFMHILQTRSLFFSRASQLGDPFEGAAAGQNVAWRQHLMLNRRTDSSLAQWAHLSDEEVSQWFANSSKWHSEFRHQVAVSCWHMSEHESVAMWKVYSQSSDSVCIQTTYRKLACYLPVWVNMGVVSYIDYDIGWVREDNGFYRMMHKRKQFEYEREVRAVAWEGMPPQQGGDFIRQNMRDAGIMVPIDLSFIESIIISPYSPSWFFDVVRTAVHQYAGQANVFESSLARVPAF
ncbi:MAG: hypothetical protein K2X44_11670 [Magnetospirillum sp.]|nr:hypothetical protein [Magnetospirillum sp.]